MFEKAILTLSRYLCGAGVTRTCAGGACRSTQQVVRSTRIGVQPEEARSSCRRDYRSHYSLSERVVLLCNELFILLFCMMIRLLKHHKW
jgi:hypothetical protein